MKKPKGIDPGEAREELKRRHEKLVRADEDIEKLGKLLLDRSIRRD